MAHPNPNQLIRCPHCQEVLVVPKPFDKPTCCYHCGRTIKPHEVDKRQPD